MEKEELFALELFGFQIVSSNENSITVNYPYGKGDPCHGLSRIASTLHLQFGSSYQNAIINISDECAYRKLITRIWFHSRKLMLIALIDNRESYHNLACTYHILRILDKHRIILDHAFDFKAVPFGLIKHPISIYLACKEYEESEWGGVDKDNSFTTYVYTQYFIVYDRWLVHDDYIAKLLPVPATRLAMSYKDYRSIVDVQPDKYWTEEASTDILQNFITNYSSEDHNAYLSALRSEKLGRDSTFI